MNKKELYQLIIESVAKEVKKALEQLNEDDCGCVGGDCGAVYNNAFNTVGMGDVVPAGHPCMTGADFANDAFNGSGDRFDNFVFPGEKKKKSKKKKTKIYTKK